jgi:hypothetical protein
MNNLPKFYVINMRRSVERLRYITNLFKKYNIKYTRIDAIDGKHDNVARMCAIKHNKCIGADGFQHTKEVLATVISHLKAIKTYAEDRTNSDEYAIIAEDDLAFDFCEYWNFTFNEFVKSAPPDWEILQLVFGTNSPDKKYNTHHSFIKGHGYFATAYLIKKNKAIEYSKKFFKNNILQNNIGINHGDYIADYLLFDHATTYTYIPSIFTYRDKNDSYLHPDHLNIHIKLKNDNKKIWEDKEKCMIMRK